MTNINLIKQFRERELIAQITDERNLEHRLNHNHITLYCGFDPTADSLHLGHLVPLLCLRRFQQAGHKPIVLVGLATSLTGDPSLKIAERNLYDKKLVKKWTNKICKQITSFLDFNCGENSAVIVNNYDWFSKMNVLTFLRDIGKFFSVNQMINREAVKHRFSRNDKGISFTEFSYSLLQGYDFFYLNKFYNTILQIGGSDQWGNIISGIDLTRRINKNQVFGMTVPLIIKDDGTKFGKTEDHTIWLDPKKTSPYKFYQFWINTKDDDVYRFLKFFTFMHIKDINSLEEDKNKNKESYAQYVLAEQVTELVHGKKGLEAAKHITISLFNDTFNNLKESDLDQLVKDGIPMIEMKKNTDLMQALVFAELQPSRRQASKIISSNAISINGQKQNNPDYIFTENDRLFGKYTFLSRGKKNYCLIRWK